MAAAGHASPSFPAGVNPEPSSPKVTCIGQVRVKTKKQGKKLMTMRGGSAKQRRSNLARQTSNGFQAAQRTQRWVHLPFAICDAVRAFGSEINCFLPCNSPCSSNKEEPKPPERSPEKSCGRWMVAVDEIEENGRQRRHVFEGIDFEEDNEISICVPPKNALLLMRCRSDPVKVEALAKRFCEAELKLSEESVSDQEKPIEMGTENEIDLQKLGIPVMNRQFHEEQRKTEALTEETMANPIPIPIKTQFESEMGEETENLKSLEEEGSKAGHGNEENPRTEENENGENPTSAVVPEWLVLMMYEPKLSMEVSKETWVCSTDFARCVPATEKKAAPPPPPKKKKKPASNTAVQPGRWSCSLPAAAMIEEKVAGAKGGYEPLALTRCKSEPMRSAAANLAADAAELGF